MASFGNLAPLFLVMMVSSISKEATLVDAYAFWEAPKMHEFSSDHVHKGMSLSFFSLGILDLVNINYNECTYDRFLKYNI